MQDTVSTQVFALDAITGVQAEQAVVREGMEKTAEAVDMLAKEHDQIQLAVNDSEKEREAMSKGSEKAALKVRATQNTLYKLQLKRSQSVIIISNLTPITSNRETYEDLEKCVGKMLKDLRVNRDGIRINSVRRLQRSKMDKSGDHPALRIELGGVGDKIKIYQAIDYMMEWKKGGRSGQQ